MARCIFNVVTRFSTNLINQTKFQFIQTQYRQYAYKSLLQSKSKFSSLPVKVFAAVCCFGVSGGAYAYLTALPTRKDRNISNTLIELSEPYVLSEAPKVKPSRKVSGPATQLGLNMILYQYQTCPFCCKVRAFLDYYGVPYDVVEVNPVMRQQLKFSNYKKVPILIVQDRKSDVKHQLNDSSVIVSILGTFLMNMYDKLEDVLKFYVPVSYTNDEGRDVIEVMNQYFLMYGETTQMGRSDKEISEERKWRKWADHDFVHVLSPNIYRSPKESLEAFNYFSKVGDWENNFSFFERATVIYVGATAMYFVGKKLRKKYTLKEDVRESLYDSCKLWMKNVGKSKFMGGDSPNLADLAVYGLLSSIEGCSAFKDALNNTNVGPWYFNVKEAVQTHQGYKDISLKSQ